MLSRSLATISLCLFFFFASTTLAIPQPQATILAHPDGPGTIQTINEDGSTNSVDGVYSGGSFYPYDGSGNNGPAPDPNQEGQPGGAP